MRIWNLKTVVFLALSSIILLSSCNKMGTGRSADIMYDSIVIHKEVPLLSINHTTLTYADVNISFTSPVRFRDAESTERLQQIFKGTFFRNTDLDTMTPDTPV